MVGFINAEAVALLQANCTLQSYCEITTAEYALLLG
jgi:hypothetical protein